MPVKPIKLGKSGAPVRVIDRIHLIQGCAGLGGSAKHLLLTLGLLFNEEMGYAFISVKHLAFLLGVDKTTITRAISVLVNEEKLIERSLRKGNWAISRKTEIFWDKLHARRVEFEPESKGPDGRVAKKTATSTLETDIATADTLDEPAPSVRGELDVVNETMALLQSRFSEHPTFQRDDAERIMTKIIQECFKKVESAEFGLAIFGWICADPINEGIRSKLDGSRSLGGYIRTCFKGWGQGFAAADQANHAYYEQCLTALCGDDDHMHFAEESATFVQPFRAWLEANVGEHLIDIEIFTDDDGTYLRVEIEDEFKTARLLEFQDSEQPNSLVDEEHDE